ncbi:hypothetical protein J1N35_014843 [Gossypium stocksii]|uniref:Uncharacterized protein n=1 Tax=Gossypium stocksii TaxID=47602 RepID=A0A9D3VV06_9ROSI|nr:hypothetical protein J1N35_014843 [Gossypium stocksii]
MYSTISQQLDNLHKIDLWGRLEEDWPTFHKRHNVKSYLLLTLEKSRQCCRWRPRRGLINPRSGEDVVVG